MSRVGVSGGGGGGFELQPWSLVQLMALTEAGLWAYRGERWRERGEADRVRLHTEVGCPFGSLQHMVKALERKKKKKTSTEKKRAGKVPCTVWEQVFQTERASCYL